MKLFGSITELVATVWRKNSQAITLRPNQTTTYTASRDIQTPPQDANSVLVSENATQTLTNKTLTAPTLTGATLTSVATLSLDDSNSAFDLTVVSTSGLTAGRTLTLNVQDGARTLSLAGNLSTSGANAITLTTTGATSITLPTSGTLSTLAGAEIITNKDHDGGTASNTSRLTLPGANVATITALTRKAGTLSYATDTARPYIDDGSTISRVALFSEIGGGSSSGITNDASSGSVTVNSGQSLLQPFLTVSSGDTYTITGQAIIIDTLIISGTYIVGGTSYILNIN